MLHVRTRYITSHSSNYKSQR